MSDTGLSRNRPPSLRRRPNGTRQILAAAFGALLAFSAYGNLVPEPIRCASLGRVGCPGGLLGPPAAPEGTVGSQWFDVTMYDYGFWIVNSVSGANESQNWTVFEGYDIHINATSLPPDPSHGGTAAHGLGLIWSGPAPNFILFTSVGSWVNGSFVAPSTASYGDTVYCTSPCGSGHSSMSVKVLNIVPATPLPAVSVSASPSSGYAPLAVAFRGSAANGTAPYHFAWDFGDINGSRAQNPSHVFESPGTYYPVLTVIDRNGLRGTAFLRIDAIATPLFRAVATATPDHGLAPLSVNFSATATGGIGPYGFSWSFGDGAVASGASASHTYRTSGLFYAVVSVQDARAVTTGADVLIDVASLVASPLSLTIAVLPGSGDLPFEADGTASVSGGEGTIAPVVWDFGDGTPRLTGTLASHVFGSVDPGPLNVTAFVSDSVGERAFARLGIALYPAPSAVLTATPPLGRAPAPVAFHLKLSGGNGSYSAVTWDFGDGTTATGRADRSHTYDAPGSYRVTVRGLDSTGHALGASVLVTLVSNGSATRSGGGAPSSVDEGPLAFLGVVGVTGLLFLAAGALRDSAPRRREPPGGES